MNKHDVISAMELSALAYQQEQPQITRQQLTILDATVTGVQCYLRQWGDCLTIIFRGTDSAQDWDTDFAFGKKEVPYGNTESPIRVHGGFLDAYKAPTVRNRIHKFITPHVHKVRITGHSYGAALAVLCSLDLQFNFPEKDYEVFLFGCPRVGNKAFQQSYNNRIFKALRIENGNDIVTKMPPKMLGFHHVGIPIHVGARRRPFVFSFRDHNTQEYYANLFMQLP